MTWGPAEGTPRRRLTFSSHLSAQSQGLPWALENLNRASNSGSWWNNLDPATRQLADDVLVQIQNGTEVELSMININNAATLAPDIQMGPWPPR